MGTFGNVSGVDRAAGPDGDQAERRPLRRAHARRHRARLARDRRGASTAACGPPPTRRRTSSSTAPSAAAASCTRTREHATALAQAGLPVRCLGTTHADHFRGDVPVTRPLTPAEVAGDYERNTGLVIVETFREPRPLARRRSRRRSSPTTGRSPGAGARRRRSRTRSSSSTSRGWRSASAPSRPTRRRRRRLVDKHYLRKHGPGAYYGQKG